MGRKRKSEEVEITPGAKERKAARESRRRERAMQALAERHIEAYVMNHRFEAAQSYIERGRHLRGKPVEDLFARWTILVREVADFNWANDAERHDIESEVEIRGLQCPYELVRDAVSDLQAKVKHGLDVLAKNPELEELLDRRFAAKVSKFVRRHHGVEN